MTSPIDNDVDDSLDEALLSLPLDIQYLTQNQLETFQAPAVTTVSETVHESESFVDVTPYPSQPSQSIRDLIQTSPHIGSPSTSIPDDENWILDMKEENGNTSSSNDRVNEPQPQSTRSTISVPPTKSTTSNADGRTLDIRPNEQNRALRRTAGPLFAVKQLQGRDVPQRTTSNTRTAMRALSVLLIHGKGCHDNISPSDTLEPSSGIFAHLRKLLFPHDDETGYRPTGYTSWVEIELLDLRHYLLEFVVHYRQKNGKQLSPETMLNYIHGIQRCFNTLWKYEIQLQSGPIFGGKNNNGLATVMDNLFREQQRKGSFVVSHNVLTLEDIVKLNKSK